MQHDAVHFFAKYIEKELGIIYSEFNHFQLQNRLEEIVKIRGLKDVGELLRMAQTTTMPADLKQLVLDIATNNETSFFRDPKLFISVKNSILPSLFNSSKSSIKIWSAACSSGQEPYSISLMLKEYQDTTGVKKDYRILATDISSRILEKAQKARFSQLEVQRGLSAVQLVKNFDKDSEDYWTLKTPIRQPVSFQKLNLLDSFEHMDKFDLIFCRNVLIYQNVEGKKRIIQKIATCMNEDSYLILGAGESMIGLADNFESVKVGDVIIYQLKSQMKKAV